MYELCQSLRIRYTEYREGLRDLWSELPSRPTNLSPRCDIYIRGSDIF